MRRMIAGLLMAASIAAHAQLTAEERKGIADTLYIGNMTLKDLEYERKPFSDPYRFPIVDLAIDKPLEGADAIMSLHDLGGRRNVAQLIALLGSQVFKDVQRPEPPAPTPPALPAEIPADLQAPIGDLLASLEHANLCIRLATEKLSPEEKRLLIESLPQWANE